MGKALVLATVLLTPSCASVINTLDNNVDEVGLVKEAMDSIVYVYVTTKEGYYSGSGIIFNQDGYILTNYHIVDEAISISVDTIDHSTYVAKVVAGSKSIDIAILKIEAYRKLKYIKLGNSDTVNVGETVYAIGNPLGYRLSVSKGIVSGVDRSLAGYTGLIQSDVSINPGSSGGALINRRGEVIGITSMGARQMGDMAFAQPINKAIEFIKAKEIRIPLLDVSSLELSRRYPQVHYELN